MLEMAEISEIGFSAISFFILNILKMLLTVYYKSSDMSRQNVGQFRHILSIRKIYQKNRRKIVENTYLQIGDFRV